MTVAILFARHDSIYKKIDGCDVYDAERDALTFDGGLPVVAHPPCRAWGRLRHFARPREGERELAIWAVEQVRTEGGVLEHPSNSTLWEHQNLPSAGQRDKYGGWTLPILQYWFGHAAEKATWLYIVGISPQQIPTIPLVLGEPEYVVQSKKRDSRPHISKADRERTPEPLARWLVELAERIGGITDDANAVATSSRGDRMTWETLERAREMATGKRVLQPKPGQE